MIRKAIDMDDRQNHTLGLTIGLQIWTGDVKDLMAAKVAAKSPSSASGVAS